MMKFASFNGGVPDEHNGNGSVVITYIFSAQGDFFSWGNTSNTVDMRIVGEGGPHGVSDVRMVTYWGTSFIRI